MNHSVVLFFVNFLKKKKAQESPLLTKDKIVIKKNKINKKTPHFFHMCVFIMSIF